MSSLNKIIILGNLGADPDIRHTPSGAAVCELRVATSEKWTDKQGQKQEETEWHRVVVWGKQAENCAQYLNKGSKVCVEGKNKTRSWEDKEGNKRYTTEIVAREVKFIGSGKRQDGNSGDNWSGEYNAPPVDNSDIPF